MTGGSLPLELAQGPSQQQWSHVTKQRPQGPVQRKFLERLPACHRPDHRKSMGHLAHPRFWWGWRVRPSNGLAAASERGQFCLFQEG